MVFALYLSIYLLSCFTLDTYFQVAKQIKPQEKKKEIAYN